VVQVQGQESVVYDLYEDMVRGACRTVAGRILREEQGLLWFATDDYVNSEDEDDDIPYGDLLLDALEQEFFKRVCTIASDMELPDRLQNYIDRKGSED
jgi:hypothetical protein